MFPPFARRVVVAVLLVVLAGPFILDFIVYNQQKRCPKYDNTQGAGPVTSQKE